MDFKKFAEDDYCDIYPNRICDNCGDCLEEEGIDVRAIKIEDIAKTVEENEFLENEYKKMIEALKEEKLSIEELDEVGEYALENESSDYVDAFDHIEYIDDLDILGDDSLEDATEEIFPGVRKLKGKY
ncbi:MULTISPECIES: hypothetical protein [Clostridium]|uniref:hypothetical protein n=1 Tax=Clostridium TaxID=1485 RepID=UPI000C0839D8|nr:MULTISPECIES: hypothetical protein [Clostridium]MDU1566075.1 hypothetical protein [Clostridium sp.]MDU2683464.1 hypothetical protein [Clostridium sp.]MDY4605751.1 hypothetical protein [Clostridium tertium]